MWQCDNCGYTDEDVSSFEEETEEGIEDTVRYCPECGSDEVFLVDDDEVDADDFVENGAEAEAEDEAEDEDEDLDSDDEDDWNGDSDGDDDW
jgi:ribosomal protein S27AE